MRTVAPIALKSRCEGSHARARFFYNGFLGPGTRPALLQQLAYHSCAQELLVGNQPTKRCPIMHAHNLKSWEATKRSTTFVQGSEARPGRQTRRQCSTVHQPQLRPQPVCAAGALRSPRPLPPPSLHVRLPEHCPPHRADVSGPIAS